jgi:hypothetical protein
MTGTIDPVAAAVPPAGRPPSTTPSGPALQGDLRHFFATEVLQLLQLAGATGCLTVERRGERISIAFDAGRPVSAQSTGRSVRIGDVLVHRGRISRDSVELAELARQPEFGERLGTILVRAGQASHDDVAAAVAEVFRRVVCRLALWPDGAFRFVPGNEGVVPDDVPLDMELDRILLEGLHRADLVQAEA